MIKDYYFPVHLTAINFLGSIENTGYQLGYPIGVPIWVLQKTRFIKIINNLNNKQPKLQNFTCIQL